MADTYNIEEHMKNQKTLEELYKQWAPNMSFDDFMKLAVKAHLINEDGTPTQWGIDNGFVVPTNSEKYLQFMDICEMFSIPATELCSLVINNELVWNEKNGWLVSAQGVKDIGELSTNIEVQEMTKKLITSIAV